MEDEEYREIVGVTLLALLIAGTLIYLGLYAFGL
jgi:hypothetical protein